MGKKEKNLCLNCWEIVSPLNPDTVKEPRVRGNDREGRAAVGLRERALSNVFKTPKQACDDVME